MTSCKRNTFLGAAVLLAVSGIAGCGGRTPDPNADPNNPGAPPPTCAEICNHVIGTCAPGANIDACVHDCDATIVKFTGCAQLDPYLRCMPTAAIECGKGQVTIVGCNDEFVALDSCGNP